MKINFIHSPATETNSGLSIPPKEPRALARVGSIILLIFIISGCADVKVPGMHYAITHPLSTKTMVSRGATKDEVIEKWGEPNEVKNIGYDDMGLKKEAWTYNAWFHNAPLDFRHFSRSKCIYFTGSYVTGFEDIEPQNGDDTIKVK